MKSEDRASAKPGDIVPCSACKADIVAHQTNSIVAEIDIRTAPEELVKAIRARINPDDLDDVHGALEGETTHVTRFDLCPACVFPILLRVYLNAADLRVLAVDSDELMPLPRVAHPLRWQANTKSKRARRGKRA